ncbi:hypothetical protein [Hymenobacter psoromatis]|uniref:hypothetical protein n=1 Tax=Hymenobacter psoromatis TaxID=1484116 RepID=UPI001CBE0A06|nr:hypothetical protein [Hymenobacter psoromatis]
MMLITKFFDITIEQLIINATVQFILTFIVVFCYGLGRKQRKQERAITILGLIRLFIILTIFLAFLAGLMRQAFFAEALFGALLVAMLAGILGYINDSKVVE